MLRTRGFPWLEGEPQLRSASQRHGWAARRANPFLLGLSLALGALTACAPGATDDNEPAETESDPASGALAGTVVVYTVRFDETSETQYFLRSGTKETRLYFEKDPDLRPGTSVRVSGAPEEDGLRVDRYQIDDDVLAGYSQPLINGTKYKARTFAFVLVDTGAGVNITKAEAQKRLFGTNPGDRSVKQYYNEVSYGTQDITGEVIGPLTYRMTGCDTRGLATALKGQLGMFDHYLWYLGSRTTACGWSGLAESGLPSRPTNDSWYNGSAGCVVLVQEPGHNFGMMHSSSMTCGAAAFADDPDAVCKHNEYGDRYDPMGGACNHMNAWQKVFEGWLQKCNGISVKSSGTYTLQPLELACDGPQVLQIPMPKVRPFGRSGGGGLPTTENIQYYYLELRTARGFDDTIRTAPTVLVRVAEDFRARTDRGRHTWILDMDPASTRTLEGLTAGKSYTDPLGGLTFKVASISADSASIEVTIPNGTGGATCLDDTPYNAATPAVCAGLATPSGISDAGVPDAGTVPPPKVESLVLVDADSGKDLMAIQDKAVLDLSKLPRNLSIRVDTDPPTVGSVAIRIDAGMVRTDATAPYSIAGDMGGKFTPWMLSLGGHTVQATAYDAADGGGRAGEPLEIDFTLTNGGTVGPGDGGLDGGPISGFDSGTVALSDSGSAIVVNPDAGDGGLLGLGDAAWAPPQKKKDDGCGCHVPGSETGTPDDSKSWAMAALAIGLFVRRRVQRSRRV
jgi:MYXO-CTERM domain-containing protein